MTLSIWTVYDNPTDMPGKFVARRFTLDAPTLDVLIDITLDGLRAKLPPGLYRMPRQDGDEPHIVETWF